MNDLDELDRRVRVHLVSTGARMPEHVRASVFEEVARHGQVRPGWSRVGQVARLSLAAGVVAVAVLVVANTPGFVDPSRPGTGGDRASPSPDFVWDAVLNFRDTNPAMDGYGNTAVWSYLHAPGGVHDPALYLRLSEFRRDAREAWIDPAHEGLAIGIDPGADRLTIEPWGRGPTEIEAAIVAWRDPVGGRISVRGLVEVDAACGDGIEVSIDQGSRVVDGFGLAGQGREIDLDIDTALGETLYLRVEPGPDGNADCDTTWLRLTITR